MAVDINLFKKGLESAKKNPNSDFAVQLRQKMEAGEFNDELRQLGFGQAAKVEPIKPTEPATQQKGRGGLSGFVTGAAKGVASTVSGISELGQRGLSAITGIKPIGGDVVKLPEKLTKPVGKAEKIGFFTEQIGEFLVPGAVAGKISKAPRAIKTAAGAGKFIKPIAKSAAEAAAITAAQRGKVDKESAKAAAFGAAGAAISPALGKLARGRFAKVVPLTKRQKIKADTFKQDIAGAVERLPLRFSRRGIQDAMESRIETLTKGVDDIIEASTSGKSVRLGDVSKNIAKELSEDSGIAQKLGITPTQLKSLRGKFSKIVNDEIRAKGGANVKLSLSDLNKFKRELNSGTKSAFDKIAIGSIKKDQAALVKLQDNLKKAIEKNTPGDDVKILNKEIGSLLAAQKGLETGNKGSSLLVESIVGAGLGGGNPLSFLGFSGLVRSLRSPTGRFLSGKGARAAQNIINNPAVQQSVRKALQDFEEDRI